MKLLIKNKLFYRPEIDGLRVLAVIAVIIYHFNKIFFLLDSWELTFFL